MANKYLFTNQQIEDALRKAGGIYTLAAAHIERATGRGCTSNTIRNYVRRSKHLQGVEDEVVNQNLDVAEAELLKQIRDGNTTAVLFYLKTKGKRRGYTERQEVVGEDGEAVKVAIVRVPMKAKTAEEWASQHDPNQKM